MATRKYNNIGCPICLRPIRGADSIRECDQCRQTFHGSCWDANGGCNGKNCRRVVEEEVRPQSPSGAETVAASSGVGGFDGRGAPTAEASVPQPAGVVPHRQSRRVWWIPLALMIFTVFIVGGLTVLLVVFGLKTKPARQEFEEVVRRADSATPREAVEIYQLYIDEHGDNRLTREIEEKLGEASTKIDDWDWQETLRVAETARTNLVEVQNAYEDYIRLQPDGLHVDEAKRKVRDLARKIDEETFAKAVNASDVHKKSELLDEYLASFPNGVNADNARRLKRAIPDELEQSRLDDLLNDLSRKRKRGSLLQAIAKIDEQVDSFASPSRRKQLRDLRSELHELAAASEAAEVLGMSTGTEIERDEAILTGELFLIRYRGTKAATQIHEFVARLRAEAWQKDVAALDEQAQKATTPGAALRILVESSVDRAALQSTVLRYFMQIYKRILLDTPIPTYCQLITKDGKTIVCVVEDKDEVYRIEHDDGKVEFMLKSKVEDLRILPRTKAAREFRQRVEAESVTDANIESLLVLAEETEIPRYVDIIHAFKVAFDPKDQQAIDHLVKSGYVPVWGGWLLASDLRPRLEWTKLADIPVSPARKKWLDTQIDTFKGKMISHGDDFAAKGVFLFPVQVFGTVQEIPMKCTVVGTGEPVVLEVSQYDKPRKVHMMIEATIELSPARPIQDIEISEIVEAATKSLSMASLFRIHLQSADEVEEVVGVGLNLALENRRWEVVLVDEDSPAFEAGVKVGDIALEIDGQSLDGMTDAVAANRLLEGLGGTTAVVRLSRQGHPYQLELTRHKLQRMATKTVCWIEHNLNESRMTEKTPDVELSADHPAGG